MALIALSMFSLTSSLRNPPTQTASVYNMIFIIFKLVQEFVIGKEQQAKLS